jgi:hypothetical protein
MCRRAAAPALALLLLLAAAARGAALGDNDAAAESDAGPAEVLFPAGARSGRCFVLRCVAVAAALPLRGALTRARMRAGNQIFDIQTSARRAARRRWHAGNCTERRRG